MRESDGVVTGFIWFLLSIVAVPLLLLHASIFGSNKDRADGREWLLYVACVFATVIVLAFLNWQFQHIGA
jgi:hypothetical protein